jgi:hypothetical protein
VKIPAKATPVASSTTHGTITDQDIATLIAQYQAQGMSQSAAMSAAESDLSGAGVDTSSTGVQTAMGNAVTPSGGLFGFSSTELLIAAALIGGIYIIMEA